MSSTRIIWGKWDCKQCGTKGISAQPPPGEEQPRCSGCGNPRQKEEGEAAYLDNARDASGKVQGAVEAKSSEEIAVATAGADWVCAFCKCDNRARFSACQGCGANRGGPISETVPNDPFAAAVEPPLVPTRGRRAVVGLAVIAVLCTGIPGYLWWASCTHLEAATIVATGWTHTASLQRYTQQEQSAWQADITASPSVMPVAGKGEYAGVENIRNCRAEHHHDQQVACGTEQECHDVGTTVSDGESCSEQCSTSDNGNGSFTETCNNVCTPNSHTEYHSECSTVTKYCAEPVYATKCDYSTWVWNSLENRAKSGSGPEGSEWPVFEVIGELDRVSLVPAYSVSLSLGSGADVKTGNPNVATAEVYGRWAVAKSGAVTVPNVGEPDFALAVPQ